MMLIPVKMKMKLYLMRFYYMPGTRAFHESHLSSQEPQVADVIIIFVLKVRKLWIEEVRVTQLSGREDFASGGLSPKFTLLTTLPYFLTNNQPRFGFCATSIVTRVEDKGQIWGQPWGSVKPMVTRGCACLSHTLHWTWDGSQGLGLMHGMD